MDTLLSPDPAAGSGSPSGVVAPAGAGPQPATDPPVSLTSDMVFKAVFGSPGSENVLSALLSAVRRDALGCAYFFGYGVEQDNERCFALWKRAAALGSARGFYHLSCAYHSGTGTEPDTELSIACCRTACELGMGIAAHRMGLRYLHGNGVSINHDQAYQFFRLGVLRGYSLSLGALRFCLAAGLTRGSRSQIGGRKEDA